MVLLEGAVMLPSVAVVSAWPVAKVCSGDSFCYLVVQKEFAKGLYTSF